jgi:diamine N-acetyltransferase
MAGNEACGYLLSHDGDPVEEDIANAISLRPTTEISKIYVSADHHGSPVAQDLLNSALRDAAGRGFASAWLGVNQLNARANAFYARNGFVEVGTRSFLVGDTWEDDFVREKLLSSQSTGNA